MSEALAPLVAFVVALLGTGAARRFALRRQVIALPNARSSHERPTPSGGGLGIAAGIAAGLICAAGFEPSLRVDAMWRALAALGIASAVGWRDDVRELRPRIKAAALLLAAALLALAPVTSVDVPLVGVLDLGLAALPLTLLWLWSFANLFNFMDGIDGIAGLTALVSGGAYAALGMRAGDPVVASLGAIVAASATGFLPWNFPRARVFMGDAGSLPLGLLLAFLGVLAARRDVLEFPASVLLLGPFVFDTLFTLARRAARGARLSEGHREHVYQRLSRRVGGHPPVSLLFAAFAAGTAWVAWGYDARSEPGKALSLTLPLAAMLAFGVLVLFVDRHRKDPASPARRRRDEQR